MQLKSVSDACTDPNCDPLESPLAQELTRARAGLPPSPPNDGASDPADATPKPTLFSRTTRFEGASSARIPAPTRTPNSGEAKDESNGSKPEVGATDGSLGKGARTKETPAKQRRQGKGRFTPGGSKNALWSPVPKTRMEKDLKERLKEQEEAVEVYSIPQLPHALMHAPTKSSADNTGSGLHPFTSCPFLICPTIAGEGYASTNFDEAAGVPRR